MGFFQEMKDKLFDNRLSGFFDSERAYDEDEVFDETDESDAYTYHSVFGNKRVHARNDADSVSVYTRSGKRLNREENAENSIEDTPALRTREIPHTNPDNYVSDSLASYETPAAPHVSRRSPGNLPPYVLRPASYEDIQLIVRRMRTNQPVVLNLKNTQRDIHSRILDFAFGLACGVDGEVEQLSDYVYVVLPYARSLSSEDKKRLMRDGVL